MAVDTRHKRFSMMTFAAHASRGTTQPLFEADATVDLDDQQHLLGMYGGIEFDGPQGAFLFQGRGTAGTLSGRLVR